jgi:hypothetical protein
VQSIAEQWLAEGYGGTEVAVYSDDLRECLLYAVLDLALTDPAAAQGVCPPDQFKPGGSPSPSEETPTDTPDASEEATPTPTPTPSPIPGTQKTAIGTYNDNPVENWTDTENTVTIVWWSGAEPGSVSGEGHHSHTRPAANGCGTETYISSMFYTGTFDPVSGTFSGTYTGQWQSTSWHESPQTGCYQFPQGGTYDNRSWGAALQGPTVTGNGPGTFTLAAQ